MSLKFIKMEGLGNDFIVIDATSSKVELDLGQIPAMADRYTGIGFDQLLLIEPARHPEQDYWYRIFNADGSEVEQCGNGARCVAHYLFTDKAINKETIILSTLGSTIELARSENGEITANMGKPQFLPEKIPFLADKEQLEYRIALGEDLIKFSALSLGNPHAVITVENVTNAPVNQIGKLLQQHPAFPKQVNVGFMEIVSPENIRLRVYERGAGETRACGSGACAAVVAGKRLHALVSTVKVELPGGSLIINWNSPDGDVYMTGPARKVYKGELY